MQTARTSILIIVFLIILALLFRYEPKIGFGLAAIVLLVMLYRWATPDFAKSQAKK